MFYLSYEILHCRLHFLLHMSFHLAVISPMFLEASRKVSTLTPCALFQNRMHQEGTKDTVPAATASSFRADYSSTSAVEMNHSSIHPFE